MLNLDILQEFLSRLSLKFLNLKLGCGPQLIWFLETRVFITVED